MSNHRTAAVGLWDDLQEAYDTYERHSFMADPPDKPFVDHWKAKGERAARIFLGMPLLPVLLFRLRTHLLRAQVPIFPYLCELLSTAVWRVSIGRFAEVGPGLIIPHGHVVIDGAVKIGRDCIINPWVTIGLSGSRRWGFDHRGPTIGDRVVIGTGAKVLGPITVGDGVRIGANAVVIDDVPPGATVVGAPARVVRSAPAAWVSAGETDSS
jgi:serine O-acetyltransferase